MTITSAQKTAIEQVTAALMALTSPRGKRHLCAMFMDLVDRAEWPEYYEVIPEPRCLNNIKAGVERGRYKDALDVYTDLSLVFWNALFYNEPGSQICIDADTLKTLLATEWAKRSVLPVPQTSPPPAAPQKVHTASGGSNLDQKLTSKLPSAHASQLAPSRIALTSASGDTRGSQILPAPVPNGSNLKLSSRPRTVLRPPTPDVDVEGVSHESDGQADEGGMVMEMERDPESEEIVKQLEKGLPRWPGFGDEGWMPEVGQEKIIEIIQVIKSYKDVMGDRPAVAFDTVPEQSESTYLSFSTPLSLKSIEARALAKQYTTSKDFDMDMARLFEKARRWHDPCTEPYGRVLLLQRLYQFLSSSNPPLEPQYVSSTHFAALRAGPGNTKPVHGSDGEGVTGVTTHRVLTRDRNFVDELHYKGWSVKLADWLHLSNPDDPSRPIIAQVFRCWISEEPTKVGQEGVTVSWYYRPEQTYHPSNRKFWEGEVFKTSHFADHPLPDIIEKIACQFTARHIRGRPRPPYWYPGWPLYVCDSRYNDRERILVKIKNWNSCVPEEVRKSVEFMPIYPFERTVFPARVKSPFLRGAVKGPGGLLPTNETTNNGADEGPDGNRKRTRKAVHAEAMLGRTAHGGNLAAVQSQHRSPAPTHMQQQYAQTQMPIRSQKTLGPDRSVIAAAGGAAVLEGKVQIEKLSSETTKHFNRDPDTNEVLWFAAPPIDLDIPRAPNARHSLAYLHYIAMKHQEEMKGSDARMKMEVDLQGLEDEMGGKGYGKRARMSVLPTVTETMRKYAKTMLIDR